MQALIIEERPDRRARVTQLVQQAFGQIDCIAVASAPELAVTLRRGRPVLALMAERLGDTAAHALLQTLLDRWPALPVLVIGETLDEAQGAELLRRGARDIVLTQQLYRLPQATRAALEPAAEQPHEAHFRALFEDAPIGIAIARTGVSLAVNRAYLRMFGYSDATQVIGQQLLRDIAPQARPQIAERVRLRDQGLPVPDAYESVGQRQDGTLFPFHVEVARMTFRGEPASVAFFTDITARKQAEERLRFLTEISAELAGSLDYGTTLKRVARMAVPHLADWCGVDMLAEDGSVQRLAVAHSDPAKETLVREAQRRYPPDPARPHPTLRVLASGQSERMAEIPDGLLETIAQDTEHLALMRALGFRSALYVPLTVRGRVLGAITLITAESGRRYSEADQVFAEDVARRCALALDNARLYAEAQQAITARDHFVTVASHELKTPLTSLLGYTRLLQRRNERELILGERDTRALNTIAQQGVRLSGLVNELLDFSRLRTGQLRIAPAPLDLAALTRRLADDLQPMTEHHQLLLEGAEMPLVVEGDESRLEQVLYNIVSNAVKYSPTGGPVTIRLERRAGEVCVAVRDQGIGIPATALGRLGEPFFRAENVSQQHISGTGIGLHIAKAILALHGGSLTVDSVEGRGTTVTICLPMSDA
ncbi:MAG TPA: ATP-binding protein [Roseiflexaceae bacterium]|nr:ATP-binding protein [Roseiflexaceae bacterium]